jgi:hypothetical protein
MPNITPESPMFPEFAERYWNAVKLSMQVVFHCPNAAADRRIREYFEVSTNDEAQNSAILFHSQPLHMAADLLGIEILTDEHFGVYDERVAGVRTEPQEGRSFLAPA